MKHEVIVTVDIESEDPQDAAVLVAQLLEDAGWVEPYVEPRFPKVSDRT